jgi:hypothetical protein
MRLVRGVRNCIIKHRIDCSRQRLKFDNSRKDRAVTDLGIDDKRRTLVDLERVKFSRRRANPLFDFRRSRALQQFSGIDTTRFSADRTSPY